MIALYPYLAPFIGTMLFLSPGEFGIHQIFSCVKPTYLKHYSSLNAVHQAKPQAIIFSTSPQLVSIPDLLEHRHDHHQQLLSIRGLITQPELHLDETELYLDFVFRLEQGRQSIIVYGRHDRTLGPPAITLHQTVEVIGTFYKEQDRNGSAIFNVLEAISVTPYPPSTPEKT
jgi:hypothetical protein